MTCPTKKQRLSWLIFIAFVLLAILLYLSVDLQNLLDFLNQNNGAIQVVSTIVLVMITGFYAWQTRRTVETMNTVDERRNRPRVSVYIKQQEDWLNIVDLVIANYGNESARNLTFSLDGELSLMREDEKLSGLGMIKNGIKELSPQRERSTRLLTLIGRVEELEEKEIKIAVNYEDSGQRREFSDSFVLDFKSLTEHQLGRTPLFSIAENVQKMSMSLEAVTRAIKKQELEKEIDAEKNKKQEA